MGVPGFFAWLRRTYPQIVDDSAGAARDGEGNACDNLYVGKNRLLHKRNVSSRRCGCCALSRAYLTCTALLNHCLDRAKIA